MFQPENIIITHVAIADLLIFNKKFMKQFKNYLQNHYVEFNSKIMF